MSARRILRTVGEVLLAAPALLILVGSLWGLAVVLDPTVAGR